LMVQYVLILYNILMASVHKKDCSIEPKDIQDVDELSFGIYDFEVIKSGTYRSIVPVTPRKFNIKTDEMN